MYQTRMTATSAIRFDMRRAPFSSVTEAEQHEQCVQMARFADEHGFSVVTISEHHGVDFISAPTTLAGVLLGATRRVQVMVNALLLTLHDPIRLAEQVATLDLVSGGRFTLVAGLGYRPEDSRWPASTGAGAAPSPRSTSRCSVRHGPAALRLARPHCHRHADPGPSRGVSGVGRRLGPPVCGASRPAALPFFTMSTDPAIGEIYRQECEKSATHRDSSCARGPLFVHVATDPDAAWEQIAPYAVYDAVSYNSWQTGDHDNVAASDASTAEQLRESGMWQVVTPERVCRARPTLRLGRAAPADGRDADRAGMAEPAAVRGRGAAAAVIRPGSGTRPARG